MKDSASPPTWRPRRHDSPCGNNVLILKTKNLAALLGYLSNHVPCSGASVSACFGGNPGLGLNGCIIPYSHWSLLRPHPSHLSRLDNVRSTPNCCRIVPRGEPT